MKSWILLVSIIASTTATNAPKQTEVIGKLPDPSSQAKEEITVERQTGKNRKGECQTHILIKRPTGTDMITFACPRRKSQVVKSDLMIVDGMMYSDKPNEIIDMTEDPCVRKTYTTDEQNHPVTLPTNLSKDECDEVHEAIKRRTSLKAIKDRKETRGGGGESGGGGFSLPEPLKALLNSFASSSGSIWKTR